MTYTASTNLKCVSKIKLCCLFKSFTVAQRLGLANKLSPKKLMVSILRAPNFMDSMGRFLFG
jgi:hypothetical protein